MVQKKTIFFSNKCNLLLIHIFIFNYKNTNFTNTYGVMWNYDNPHKIKSVLLLCKSL